MLPPEGSNQGSNRCNVDTASITAKPQKGGSNQVATDSNPDTVSITEERLLPLVENPKLSNDFETTPLDGINEYVSKATISGRRFETQEYIEKGRNGRNTFSETLTDTGLDGVPTPVPAFKGRNIEQEEPRFAIDDFVNYRGERVQFIGFRRQEPRMEIQYPSGSKTFVRAKDLTPWKTD